MYNLIDMDSNQKLAFSSCAQFLLNVLEALVEPHIYSCECTIMWAQCYYFPIYMQTCRHDLTSFSTCNVTTPLVTGPSEEQLKPCDPSPCRVFSGTGYDLAAHAKDLNPVTLPRLPQSLKAGHDHEKPEAEKTQTSVKRARRT